MLLESIQILFPYSSLDLILRITVGARSFSVTGGIHGHIKLERSDDTSSSCNLFVGGFAPFSLSNLLR